MSAVYVTIKLDPYYQQYLRGFYSCYSDPFVFPRLSRKNYLPYALIEALWYPPREFRLQDHGRAAFRIEVPEMPDKDINSMNYISPVANEAYVQVIERFYFADWYKFADDKYALGYGPKDIMNMFLERYNIDCSYTDRLLRDFTRFANWRKVKKHRKKISISAA